MKIIKEAVVTMLAVSLLAVPVFAGSVRQQANGLTHARIVSLEHAQGAWQMQIKCDEGVGAISLIDVGQQKSYRGSGLFSAWSQEKMGAMYESLLPKDNSPLLELMQLG